ncbi:aldose reductase [Kwoniella heveanensis CBS 569]|uniref:Aldose reductase n=1 Tax=Kwoniella heveanensis BCC8398 TaxID=1296120 RepID=A0A1B9GQS0_9TREE|nr:aldose reductase [Kwoniella heveanensis BCC8398]OCF39524.1 aldose reductase [Kwoniella heveanensis CBS 569]
MTRTIKLSDGKSIPALGWGNGSGGLNGKNDPAVVAGVEALNAGLKHIDTAELYKTEKATAEAIEKTGVNRKDIWITTKNKKADPEAVRATVEERISFLGGKPDLLLIHNPFVIEEGKIGQYWTLLEDLVYDGTLEGVSLGVSNFRPQDLQDVLKVARIKPVVNQLEFHPYVLSHLEPVLAIHAQNGIRVEAYGPLTPLLRHPTGGPIKPILERISGRLEKEAGKPVDIANVLQLWTIQYGAVAVTTSTKPDNIKKLAEVDSLPDLTSEEVKEIEEAGKKIHFRHYKEHMTKDFPEPDLPSDL